MAQTIEEFVISLGLKVDKAAEQRFTSALGGLAKTFAVLAAGLTATAASIQATVVAVSKSFDNLYFAAQRTNSTVAGIKSLSYAFTQIGGTADEAMGAISGLAKAMRTNPGMIPWLNGQGIKTAGKDVKQILMDAADVFSQKDYHISNQFAEMIGIPEETWNKWVKNKDQIRKFEAEQEAAQRRFGVDPKKAAESSNELMTKFRSLTMELGVLFEKITVALQPQLNQLMADIAKWFEEHQDQIVKALDAILRAANDIFEWAKNFLLKIGEVATKINDVIEALIGERLSLKFALELLAGGALLAFVTQWGLFLASLAKNPTFWALAMIAATGGLIYKGITATDEEWAEAGRLASGTNSDGVKGLEGAAGQQSWFTRNIINPIRGVFGAGKVDDIGKPLSGGGQEPPGALPGVDARLSAAIQAAAAQSEYDVKIQSGFRPGDPRFHGKGEAVDVKLFDRKTGKALPNYQDASAFWQYKAFADRVHDEYIKGGGNPNDLRWGGYFSGPPGKYGALDTMHLDVAGRRGVPMGGGGWENGPTEEQRRIWNLDRWKDKQSELFGAPALGSSSARLASISNRTSITVYGSSDPAGTAANLNGAQSRVASELIRNGQSAFV